MIWDTKFSIVIATMYNVIHLKLDILILYSLFTVNDSLFNWVRFSRDCEMFKVIAVRLSESVRLSGYVIVVYEKVQFIVTWSCNHVKTYYEVETWHTYVMSRPRCKTVLAKPVSEPKEGQEASVEVQGAMLDPMGWKGFVVEYLRTGYPCQFEHWLNNLTNQEKNYSIRFYLITSY